MSLDIKKEDFSPRQLRRFSQYIDTSGDCWEWCGGLNVENGYGIFTVHRTKYIASRYSWEAYNGKIPDGLSVLHKCNNKRCVRPEHLYLGTYSDNMQYIYKSAQSGVNKLTENEVRGIKGALKLTTLSQRTLARLFSVTPAKINAISRGLTWTWVEV